MRKGKRRRGKRERKKPRKEKEGKYGGQHRQKFCHIQGKLFQNQWLRREEEKEMNTLFSFLSFLIFFFFFFFFFYPFFLNIFLFLFFNLIWFPLFLLLPSLLTLDDSFTQENYKKNE